MGSKPSIGFVNEQVIYCSLDMGYHTCRRVSQIWCKTVGYKLHIVGRLCGVKCNLWVPLYNIKSWLDTYNL